MADRRPRDGRILANVSTSIFEIKLKDTSLDSLSAQQRVTGCIQDLESWQQIDEIIGREAGQAVGSEVSAGESGTA